MPSWRRLSRDSWRRVAKEAIKLCRDLLAYILYQVEGTVYYTWGPWNAPRVRGARRLHLHHLTQRVEALEEAVELEDSLSDEESDSSD